jgi:hypothetical protein
MGPTTNLDKVENREVFAPKYSSISKSPVNVTYKSLRQNFTYTSLTVYHIHKNVFMAACIAGLVMNQHSSISELPYNV